mmetsp:Transcript_50659/g.109916  ORF Transcript_50659/g.109916 Transcript_50659/m.109916 type:complete len:250 (-) Transcript_50659:277-1026(-)
MLRMLMRLGQLLLCLFWRPLSRPLLRRRRRRLLLSKLKLCSLLRLLRRNLRLHTRPAGLAPFDGRHLIAAGALSPLRLLCDLGRLLRCSRGSAGDGQARRANLAHAGEGGSGDGGGAVGRPADHDGSGHLFAPARDARLALGVRPAEFGLVVAGVAHAAVVFALAGGAYAAALLALHVGRQDAHQLLLALLRALQRVEEARDDRGEARGDASAFGGQVARNRLALALVSGAHLEPAHVEQLVIRLRVVA